MLAGGFVMFARSIRVALCAVAVFGLPVAALARPFTLDDYPNVVRVGNVQIAPDGTRIIFTRSKPDFKKDQTTSALMIADVASGTVRALTQQRERVGGAQWSPDGTMVSFVAASGEGKDARPQVWVLPMNGGDAHPVTTAPNG